MIRSILETELFGDVIIRDYIIRDQDNVVELYQEAFAEPPWNESWKREEVLDDINLCFRQKNPMFLVAELEYTQELIGFRWAYELPLEKFPFLSKIISQGEAVYGDELAVRRKFRNIGLGAALMKTGFQMAKNLQYKYFVGRTDIQSKMVPLYERLGYENTGIADPQYLTRFYFIKRL